MFIDTHAHLNFNAYRNDADEVIRRSLESNVWVINIGTKYETSKKAVEIAEKYPEGIFAATGLHPIHLETGLVKIRNDVEEIEVQTIEEDFGYEKYKELTRSGKVVAIGEIGLDYYWRPKTTKKKELFKQKQKDLLLKQLELAKELSLPVIFHCRMAHDDLYEVISNFQFPISKLNGVVHCFTGDWNEAEKYLEMGLYLGFNGLIFKPAPYRTEGSGAGMNFDEIIKKVPLEKILIETDCPYLTPPQAEGRNEPLYVRYVAEEIAKIKNISYKKISEITTENAKKLFKI